MLNEQGVIGSLRAAIREVPGFPREGILYYDITTILKDADRFREAIDLMTAPFLTASIDLVVSVECRGIIFGSPIAYALGAGFVPIRKLGKLPAATVSRDYELEYAVNTLEIHADAVQSGQRVLLVDDLLATGGTIAASLEVIRELGGIPVGVVVLVELEDLRGRQRLVPHGVEVISFIRYSG